MNKLNPIIDPNAKMVSGPVNVIRLEGTVHGIKKVIYLFMDYHMNVDNQTQCENVFSEDVQKYFTNSFYALNEGTKIYDFFVEIYPSELADTRYQRGIVKRDHKDKYIEEVVKLFRKIFRYDTKTNKVSINRLFKNIRLHYLDVRDYYKHTVHDRVSKMVGIARSFMKNDDIDINGLDQIIRLMETMRNHLEFIVDILAGTPNKSQKKSSQVKLIKENPSNALDVQALEYITNKIRHRYKYADVKKVMNSLIENTVDNFETVIDELDETIDLFNTYADEIEKTSNKLIKDANTSYMFNYGLSAYTIRQMITDIVNKVESLVEEKFIEFFARFTDIYFLRRFLDKDYITNAIVYSGALHSSTYISILVKSFNFKITHASYTKISDMNKLTAEVKKRSLMEMQDLVLPVKFQQCSDMTHFPEEFL